MCSILSLATGFVEFVSKIPNGERISNPCKPDELWKAVGHQNPNGEGARNPFGRDFERFGKVIETGFLERRVY